MKEQYKDIHPSFKLEGSHFTIEELNDVAYSLIKEGDKEERLIGDFLMDWISPHDTIIVRTSGSTGKPKSITLSKQAMVNSALATGAYLGIKENDSALLCLSASHIAAKMMLVRAMVLGLSLDTVTPSSSPLSGVQKTYDFSAMVPMQLEKSLNHISRIGTLLVGGAPLSRELKEKAQKSETRIFETYGMTETCSHIAVRAVNGRRPDDKNKDKNPFKTLSGITVSKDERDCLVIHASDLGIESLKTNDIVNLVSETEFEWLGRWDNVINSGGIKLIPESIEEKLSPLLKDRIMVTGMPDEELGEKLVLLVEGEGDAGEILDQIAEVKTLDKFEKPKEVHFISNFPLSVNGKLDRIAIREQVLA